MRPRSAWNKNSANFAFRGFSEVGLVGAACTLYAVLRCGLSAGKPMQPRIRPFEVETLRW
jgi:hypothetical protein